MQTHTSISISPRFAVDYERGQLPRCIVTGKYSANAKYPDDDEDDDLVKLRARIAITPSGHVIAISSFLRVQLFSALADSDAGDDGPRCDAMLTDVYRTHADDEFLGCTRMFFTPHDDGRHLLVAAGRQVRAFNNLTGMRVRVLVARKRLAESGVTSALRERLQRQIAEDEERLRALEK